MEYIKRAGHKSTPAPGTPHATYVQGRNKVVIQKQADLMDSMMQEASLFIIDIVVSSSFLIAVHPMTPF